MRMALQAVITYSFCYQVKSSGPHVISGGIGWARLTCLLKLCFYGGTRALPLPFSLKPNTCAAFMGCWWIAGKRGVPTDTQNRFYLSSCETSLHYRGILWEGKKDKNLWRRRQWGRGAGKKSFIFLASYWFHSKSRLREKREVKGQNFWNAR